MKSLLFAKLMVFCVISICLQPTHLHADLIWTGAGDAVSLYQEANWLDNGGIVPGAGQIDPGVLITAATGGIVRIDSGTGSPSNFGGNFVIGSNDLIVGGGKTLRSVTAGGVNTTGQSTTVTDGSTLYVQFVTNSSIEVSGGSTVRLVGGGNPLNVTTLNFLDTASVLQFDNEDYAAFNTEHSSKVTFNGAALVFGSDPFAIEAGDNAVASSFATSGVQINFTAVPEPTSALLLSSFLGLTMLRRRR